MLDCPIRNTCRRKQGQRQYHQRLVHCREGWRGCPRDNDIDLELNEFGCDFGDTFGASFPPSNLDRNRSSLDPSKFTQARHKGIKP